MWHYRRVLARFQIVLQLLTDLAGIIPLAVRRQGALTAEILMLRRQLALYVERGVKPRRIDPATRITLALLSRFLDWRDALVVALAPFEPSNSFRADLQPGPYTTVSSKMQTLRCGGNTIWMKSYLTIDSG